VSPFADLAEARILEAIEAGQFRDLQGKGQPLDLDSYFAAPASLRAGFGVLKSAGLVPAEVEAIRYLNVLREQLKGVVNPDEQTALKQEILMRETEAAMALERMRRSLKADQQE
jgi:hypothetical protein